MSKGSEVGMKFDGEKADFSLIPEGIEEGIAKVFTYGAKKYARDNWKSVRPVERYYSAARRHIESARAGVWLDEESGLPHLDHAIVSLIMYRELLQNEAKSSVRTSELAGQAGC